MIPVDKNLYRGPRPESMSDIPGIKTLIDLESGLYDFLHPAAHQKYLDLSKSVIRVAHVRLSDIWPATKEELDRCVWYMTNLVKPVYVHCRYGKDRTGIVCAYYRVKVNGWSQKMAFEEMYDLGFHRFPYWYWVPALIKALR